ncbi:STAS domain-containing protein [Sphaerisporangium rufum]|nr:STAS domain-containing protein [Sphaerisporangium rufum]
MDIRVERQDHCTVLHVTGDLDFHGTPLFYTRVDGVGTAGSPCMVLELSGVRFCDSAGLGALVYAFNRMKAANGRLVLVAVPQSLRRRLRISGLESHFAFRDTVQEVLPEAGSV